MSTILLFVLQILLSFKSIVCDSEGILSCESSTIDQYKCIWEAPSNSRHLTYNIKSTSEQGYRFTFTPIRNESKGNRTIYYFDSDNGGHYNKQTISIYSTDAAGKTALVSGFLEFNPYTQAIPNTVTNVEFNVTEMSIDVTWQKPSDLVNSAHHRKLLYKLHYWNQQVNETTEMVDEQQYTIRGLLPHTTYIISLACRFKLSVLDEKAKWGKPISKTVTTTTTTGFAALKEFPQWIYVLIGVIGGMALVVISILFVVQTKRKCYNLDLNTSSEVLSYVRKWEDLTYAPAKIEDEQYNELRLPQSHLQAVSHQVAHPELSSAPDITAVQETYEPFPFQNGDGIKPVDVNSVPTLTEDRMSDSSSQHYSYVKLNMTSSDFTMLEEAGQRHKQTYIPNVTSHPLIHLVGER